MHGSRVFRSLAKRLDVGLLPPLPALASLPAATSGDARFLAEQSGRVNVEWIRNLPQFERIARDAQYLPDKEAFWNLPLHEALDVLAQSDYATIVNLASRQHWPFLLLDAIDAHDAPLPHMVYEDMMKAMTFSSLQKPPEQQFQLSSDTLRTLLVVAAHHVLHDVDYFAKVESWYRRVLEPQQTLDGASMSAFVMCCIAANEIDKAFAFASEMHQHGIAFDTKVFISLMHPSASPQSVLRPHRAEDKARGMLLQARLHEALHAQHGVVPTVAHAAIVYYALTQRPAKQWEVFRHLSEWAYGGRGARQETGAAAGLVSIREDSGRRGGVPARTLELMMRAYVAEGGRRCGPLTVQSLVVALHAAANEAGCREGVDSGLSEPLVSLGGSEMLESYETLLACLVYVGHRSTELAANRRVDEGRRGEVDPPRSGRRDSTHPNKSVVASPSVRQDGHDTTATLPAQEGRPRLTTTSISPPDALVTEGATADSSPSRAQLTAAARDVAAAVASSQTSTGTVLSLHPATVEWATRRVTAVCRTTTTPREHKPLTKDGLFEEAQLRVDVASFRDCVASHICGDNDLPDDVIRVRDTVSGRHPTLDASSRRPAGSSGEDDDAAFAAALHDPQCQTLASEAVAVSRRLPLRAMDAESPVWGGRWGDMPAAVQEGLILAREGGQRGRQPRVTGWIADPDEAEV